MEISRQDYPILFYSLSPPLKVLPQLEWDAQGRPPGPDLLCRLVKYLQVFRNVRFFLYHRSDDIDRHYAICCPLQAHRDRATQRCSNVIVLAWLLSLLLSLPEVRHPLQ